MTIDLKPLLDNIKTILSQTWDEQKPELEIISNEYLAGAETRTKDLAAKLAEDNDTDFFFERLKEEPIIIESQLLSLELIAKTVAQDTLSKIWQVVYDFATKLLSDIITKKP